MTQLVVCVEVVNTLVRKTSSVSILEMPGVSCAQQGGTRLHIHQMCTHQVTDDTPCHTHQITHATPWCKEMASVLTVGTAPLTHDITQSRNTVTDHIARSQIEV